MCAMKIRFWGVRGSFPFASADVIRYGGNTPCVEIETEDGLLVIDAGTGIRGLGKSLRGRGVRHVDLLLSHAHWDHIQGFPHFEPLHDEGFSLTVHALRHPRYRLADILGDQQQAPFFPVRLADVAARIEFREVEDGDAFDLAGARVRCQRLNHPGVTGGFRVEAGGRSVAYLSDTDLAGERLLAEDLPDAGEGWLERLRQGACDLGHNADLLICDTFFLSDDYDPAWGHSRVQDFIDFADRADAGAMCLFHHRPNRSDDDLDALVAACSTNGCSSNRVQVIAAREGLEIDL
jgi:phosphoribosyl 1,2-cyclic phosphodiesterase